MIRRTKPHPAGAGVMGNGDTKPAGRVRQAVTNAAADRLATVAGPVVAAGLVVGCLVGLALGLALVALLRGPGAAE